MTDTEKLAWEIADQQSKIAMEQAILANKRAELAMKQGGQATAAPTPIVQAPVVPQSYVSDADKSVNNFGYVGEKRRTPLSLYTRLGLPIVLFIIATFTVLSAWVFFAYNSQFNIFALTHTQSWGDWISTHAQLNGKWNDVGYASMIGALLTLFLGIWEIIRARHLKSKEPGFLGVIFLILTYLGVIGFAAIVLSIDISALARMQFENVQVAVRFFMYPENMVTLITWLIVVTGAVAVIGSFCNIFYSWRRTRYVYLR